MFWLMIGVMVVVYLLGIPVFIALMEYWEKKYEWDWSEPESQICCCAIIWPLCLLLVGLWSVPFRFLCSLYHAINGPLSERLEKQPVEGES